MSDLFTLKTIPLTSELGMALKNFRIENKVTAKSITENFNKASSYITKLEKGDIKKIDADFLIQLCNYITNSDHGLADFLSNLALKYKEFTNETKLIIMNLDDLLLDYPIPDNFITDIINYISENNLTTVQLTEMINTNEDIARNKEISSEDYINFPTNIWYEKNNQIEKCIIKLDMPINYIDDILNHKTMKIHRVIAEAILYNLYKLGNEENARHLAYTKLELYHFAPIRNTLKITSENIDEILGNLEPDVADALMSVNNGLKFITSLSRDVGAKRIKQINTNMEKDLGFCFAYMSANIVALEKNTKEKKKEFLEELKLLIDKYSQEDTNIDLYD